MLMLGLPDGFVSVKVIGSLAAPVTTVPKSAFGGLMVGGGRLTPVPVSGEPLAPAVVAMRKVAVRMPSDPAAGVKRTTAVHEAPPASDRPGAHDGDACSV